jgi:hypothetical protein
MKPIHMLMGAATIFCGATGVVHAQHAVTMTTTVERVENPLLANVSPGGVTVLRIAPNYTFESQQDRSRSRLSVGAVFERSSDAALLANRDLPSLGYTWAYSWPTANLELRAALAESTTRETEFADLGRITTDSRERSVSAGAVWDQELTARTRATLSATNTRVSYDTVLLEGYREFEASSRFTWDATERTDYFLEPAYARLTPSGTGAASSQSRLVAGLRQALAPDLSFTAFAGQARLGGAQGSTGSLGGAQLSYVGSRLTSDLEWSNDLSASTTTRGYVRTETLGWRLMYRISEGATVSTRIAGSRSGGVAGSRGSTFGWTLENELSPRWVSTLAFEARRTRDRFGNSGKGWAIRAGLVYAFAGR